MYSAGITLLQMAFPLLRNDNTLISFNKALGEKYNWDLKEWRRAMEKRGSKEYREGFETLDALGGGGWDLVVNLVQRQPSDRLTAPAALAHPWFDSSLLAAMTSTVETFGRAASKVTEAGDGWLLRQIARSGTSEAGGFTEAQLSEELEKEMTRNSGPIPTRSNTMVWWQSRQKAAQEQLKDRREEFSQNVNRARRQAKKTVAEGGKKLKTAIEFPTLPFWKQ